MTVIKATRVCIASAVIFSSLIIMAMFMVSWQMEKTCADDSITSQMEDNEQDLRKDTRTATVFRTDAKNADRAARFSK